MTGKRLDLDRAMERDKRLREAANGNPAKEAAIKLIQRYVERGDSLESLRESHMGSSSPGGMSAHIGGYLPAGGKFYSIDWILVERDVNGDKCLQAFKLKEIYDLCKSGQQTLL